MLHDKKQDNLLDELWEAIAPGTVQKLKDHELTQPRVEFNEKDDQEMTDSELSNIRDAYHE